MRLMPAIAASCVLLSTHARSSVPLTPAGNGHLVIPAFVNGKGTVPFILDTGADESSVYEWFAKQQGFPAGAPINVTGMTGSTTVSSYQLDSLMVDGRKISHVEATGLPDRKDADITAGVTGNDLMDGSITAFDYPCHMVTITPKPASMRVLISSKAVLIKGGSVREGTQLTFPVAINGATGTAILDTGSRGTQINELFAREAGLDVNGPAFASGETLYGAASKPTKTREGKVDKVTFAGIALKGLTVRVADLAVFKSWGIGDRPAMIFGVNAMQEMRVIYDHQAKLFWFDRSLCKVPAPQWGRS